MAALEKILIEREKIRYFSVPVGVDLIRDMEERLKVLDDDDRPGVGPKQLRQANDPKIR